MIYAKPGVTSEQVLEHVKQVRAVEKSVRDLRFQGDKLFSGGSDFFTTSLSSYRKDLASVVGELVVDEHASD